MKESIEIVEKFNQENRYRDGGKINNAIAEVLKMAKWYHSKIDEVNCQNTLIDNFSREIEKLNKIIENKDKTILKLVDKL